MIVLNQYGIHVERETSEGIGSLDFKCLFTTKDRKLIILPIEFKLAHHKRLKHGIETQLPKYMKAVNSDYGIYVVLWFKDKKGKYFNKPEKGDKESSIHWLEDKAEKLKNDMNLIIQTILIDASIKISASN